MEVKIVFDGTVDAFRKACKEAERDLFIQKQICVECGKVFIPSLRGRGQVFCSHNCGARVVMRRKRLRDKARA